MYFFTAFMVAGYYIKFGTVWDYRFDASQSCFNQWLLCVFSSTMCFLEHLMDIRLDCLILRISWNHILLLCVTHANVTNLQLNFVVVVHIS